MPRPITGLKSQPFRRETKFVRLFHLGVYVVVLFRFGVDCSAQGEWVNLYFGVWRSEIPLSDTRAAKQYAALSEGQDAVNKFDAAVYAFYSQLIELYPALDMLPEDGEGSSPWASSPDFSGVHVSIHLHPDHYATVFPVILHVAEKNGLVCFDPQNAKVHLPSCLQPKKG